MENNQTIVFRLYWVQFDSVLYVHIFDVSRYHIESQNKTGKNINSHWNEKICKIGHNFHPFEGTNDPFFFVKFIMVRFIFQIFFNSYLSVLKNAAVLQYHLKVHVKGANKIVHQMLKFTPTFFYSEKCFGLPLFGSQVVWLPTFTRLLPPKYFWTLWEQKLHLPSHTQSCPPKILPRGCWRCSCL